MNTNKYQSSITRLSKWLASAMAITLLAACATSTGPKFAGLTETAADVGDVYVYRTAAFYAFAQSFDVYVDGNKVGGVANATYLKLALKPGSHTLKVVPGGLAKVSELAVEVDTGKAAFYQYDFVTGPLANYFFIGSSIKPRDKAAALEDLKELQMAGAK